MKFRTGKCMGVLAAAALLSACGGMLRSNAPQESVYVLHAAAAGSTGEPVPFVLAVIRPQVLPGLDTDRIALLRTDNQLDFYAGGRWGENLPKVLQALTIESLLTQRRFTTVVNAEQVGGARGDFELLLTARHFQARQAAGDAPPQARVEFECVLMARAPQRVVGRCDAAAVEVAAANRMGEIVAALERAAQRALTDVGDRAAALARTELKK
jgi:ABC-type uncharacterized transport system auxiliary subunit